MEPLYVYKNDDLEKYEGMCVYVRGDDMETKKRLKYKQTRGRKRERRKTEKEKMGEGKEQEKGEDVGVN